MSQLSQIRHDNSLLSRCDQIFYRLEITLALAGGIAIFGLMFLAVVSIGGRNLFNAPLSGYVDLIEQAMPLIAYGAVSYCHRFGGHVRMDILVNRLSPRMLWGLEALLTFLVFMLFLALIWGSFAHFERSFDLNAPLWSRDSSLDIALPLWPMKLLIPVLFSLFSIRLLLQFWAYFYAFLYNIPTPVAVPMPENAADVAAREAKLVKES